MRREMTPRKSHGSLVGLSGFRGVSHEECGILVRTGDVIRIEKVPNVAADPVENYGITLRDYTGVSKKLAEGEKIVGFIHTHLSHQPSCPSEADRESAAENPGMLHAVYKPDTGEVTWYTG